MKSLWTTQRTFAIALVKVRIINSASRDSYHFVVVYIALLLISTDEDPKVKRVCQVEDNELPSPPTYSK